MRVGYLVVALIALAVVSAEGGDHGKRMLFGGPKTASFNYNQKRIVVNEAEYVILALHTQLKESEVCRISCMSILKTK